MIASATITISQDKSGKKYYEYSLGNGDVYQIGKRWLANCNLPIPTKKSLLVFGGKVLVVIDWRPWLSHVKAVEAKGLWLLRHRLSLIWKQFINRFK